MYLINLEPRIDIITWVDTRSDTDIVKGKEEIATSALLQTSTGQGIALKIFPAEIGKHLDRVQPIDIYAAANLTAHKDALVRIDNALVDGKVRPIASLVGADGSPTALGIASNDTPTLAPGTVVRADLQPASLDPKLRITIGSGQKAIGIIPPKEFEYREIPPTPEQFKFVGGASLQENRVNIGGKTEYQVSVQGELLGIVEKSSQARAASMVGSEVIGEYSRGQYTGRNANGGLKMNVKALVEHQPVAREMPEVSQAEDKSIRWAVAPRHRSEVGGVGEGPKMYQPTRGELIRWYVSSKAAGEDELEDIALAAGKKLISEFKTSGTGDPPPKNYSSPTVLVSEDLRERMEGIVKEQAVQVVPTVSVIPRVDIKVREDIGLDKSVSRGR